MKIIFNNIQDRVQFARVIRKEFPEKSLLEALNTKSIANLSEAEVKHFKALLERHTTISVESEPYDGSCWQEQPNYNIEPPQIYIDATAWYNEQTPEVKSYVDALVAWSMRPAAC